ncbi:hypothetical protein Tco_1521509, partial [Tanacetum coccineum]
DTDDECCDVMDDKKASLLMHLFVSQLSISSKGEEAKGVPVQRKPLKDTDYEVDLDSCPS